MGGPLFGFWLHLSFKMQTLLSEQKKKKKEDVALIRGILNTLLTPQKKKKN